jgi:hypothetical protein
MKVKEIIIDDCSSLEEVLFKLNNDPTYIKIFAFELINNIPFAIKEELLCATIIIVHTKSKTFNIQIKRSEWLIFISSFIKNLELFEEYEICAKLLKLYKKVDKIK